MVYGSNPYVDYDCKSCVEADAGQFCLFKDDWTEGLCCKTDEDEISSACQNLGTGQFCANGNEHNNRLISEFVCPVSETYCPFRPEDLFIEITESNVWVEREHIWDFETPTLDAKNWFCKFHI